MDWIIRSHAEPNTTDEGDTFWSNTQGWVDYASATIYTQHERETLSLPVGGAWEQL